jgi:hypothetical protein
MKKQVGISLATSLASVLFASAAGAQTVVTTPPPAQTTVVAAPARETVVTGGPNSAMLGSGLFAFGLPYLASVIVAAESDRSADKNLYVPVVGPWVDFANRGSCGGLAQPSCDGETGNKVLLAADGILQGIGALEIVGAFLMPETRTVASSPQQPRIMMGPSHVGRSGYGLAAVGTF